MPLTSSARLNPFVHPHSSGVFFDEATRFNREEMVFVASILFILLNPPV
jgi:hypothetical protein